jgi:hypothetical protein
MHTHHTPTPTVLAEESHGWRVYQLPDGNLQVDTCNAGLILTEAEFCFFLDVLERAQTGDPDKPHCKRGPRRVVAFSPLNDVATIIFDRTIVRLRLADFDQLVSLCQRAIQVLQPQVVREHRFDEFMVFGFSFN